MAKEKQIVVAGLNIVTQPHSPDGYVKLMRSLHRLKRAIAIRGAQHLMIGELRPIDREQPLAGLFGRIYRFDQIDPDAPWFNIDNSEVATEEEMAEVHIPPKLKPNLMMFDFVFFPRGHKLYFEAKSEDGSLGPISLKRMFDKLCLSPRIVDQHGKVEVTVIPEKGQLERLLKLHRLQKLAIDVKRPNPDELEDEEALVFERLDRMGARRIVEVVTAEPGESIKPDEELQILARVAAHNGSVSVVGYTEAGARIDESTINRPWFGAIPYDPNVQVRSNALIEEMQRKHGNA